MLEAAVGMAIFFMCPFGLFWLLYQRKMRQASERTLLDGLAALAQRLGGEIAGGKLRDLAAKAAFFVERLEARSGAWAEVPIAFSWGEPPLHFGVHWLHQTQSIRAGGIWAQQSVKQWTACWACSAPADWPDGLVTPADEDRVEEQIAHLARLARTHGLEAVEILDGHLFATKPFAADLKYLTVKPVSEKEILAVAQELAALQ